MPGPRPTPTKRAPAKKAVPKGETLLPSEVAAQRELAYEAGYVSPYPEAGQALVPTIDDRCESCRWTLYVSLTNEVYCANPKCAETGVRLVAAEEES